LHGRQFRPFHRRDVCAACHYTGGCVICTAGVCEHVSLDNDEGDIEDPNYTRIKPSGAMARNSVGYDGGGVRADLQLVDASAIVVPGRVDHIAATASPQPRPIRIYCYPELLGQLCVCSCVSYECMLVIACLIV